jgi:hypothetical protein
MTGPRWTCAQHVYEFGEVWQGSQVRFAFEIRNTGHDALDILDVMPECHCIVVGAFSRRVPPGATVQVPLTLVTAGLSKHLVKSATIRLSDSKSPMLMVSFQGTVKTVLTLTPPDLGLFGEIQGANPEATREGDLVSNVTTSIKLELVPVQGRSPFDLSIKEVDKGKKWHLTLKTVLPLPAGYSQVPFQIKTNHPKLPVWFLTASVYRPSRIYAQPQAIRFSSGAAASQPWSVDILSSVKLSFKVLKAEIPDDAKLHAEVQPRDGGYRVILSGPAGYQPAAPRKLIVTTDDKECPRIDIPLYRAFEPPILPQSLDKSQLPAASAPSAGSAATRPG